jgi:23S rRNA A2030 N6-methylase RlmJ
MIVRISGEGQYRLSDEAARRLNELDNELVRLVESADEAGFRARFRELIEWVRSQGQPVPPDELVASDVILPPPDVTLEEARSVFQGEGLVPG